MSLPRVQSLVLAAAAAAALASTSSVNNGADDSEYTRLQALGEASYDTALGALASNSTCTADNIVVRRSWLVAGNWFLLQLLYTVLTRMVQARLYPRRALGLYQGSEMSPVRQAHHAHGVRVWH